MQSGWKVLAASVAGSGHLTRGVECQDAHGYRVLSGQTLAIAIADGAGSARHSATGSRMAVDNAMEYLTKAVFSEGRATDEIVCTHLRNAAALAREKIYSHCRLSQEESLDENIAAADLATTLLLVLMCDSFCGVLQIGDGGIVAERSDSTFEVLTVAGNQEYINETTFLTSDSAIENSHVKFIADHGFRGVAVMTDGIQLLAIDHIENKAFPPFFSSLFRFARTTDVDNDALSSFLCSQRVCERTDDDKTLILAAML